MRETKEVYSTSHCPKCGHRFMKSLEKVNYCPNCGENQKDYQMADCCSTSSEMPRVIVFHP